MNVLKPLQWTIPFMVLFLPGADAQMMGTDTHYVLSARLARIPSQNRVVEGNVVIFQDADRTMHYMGEVFGVDTVSPNQCSTANGKS